ncbi:MAG: PEP-CTERM sorting domain-containing protein [Verrucomicrobia bacterium]|nr:PEP-CTERM sorting domain-containing protein [Verrucomicrobiota bacterium]
MTANQFLATNGANSVVNFNGGTLNSGGSLVSNGVTFTVGDGVSAATLNLMGGTHTFSDGFSLSSNATLSGVGAIIGSFTNLGTIAPGNSFGTISIAGDLALMESSLLELELGGTNAGEYDHVDITGLLKAGGWLTVTLADGYRPSVSNVFHLFNAGSITGSFAGLNLPGVLNPPYDWDTRHLLAPPSDPLSGTIMFLPEPSTVALLLAGLAGLLRRRRRT